MVEVVWMEANPVEVVKEAVSMVAEVVEGEAAVAAAQEAGTTEVEEKAVA